MYTAAANRGRSPTSIHPNASPQGCVDHVIRPRRTMSAHVVPRSLRPWLGWSRTKALVTPRYASRGSTRGHHRAVVVGGPMRGGNAERGKVPER